MSKDNISENEESTLNKEKKSQRRTLIGGQALLEGVMMRGRSAIAMAVRTPEGDIALDTKRLKSAKSWYKKVPLVRGVVAFVGSLVSGVTTLTKSAEVSSPDEEALGKGWTIFAVVLGIVLGVGIFMLLPSYLSTVLIDYVFKIKGQVLVSSIIEGVLRILIFILYLFLVSKMKDIKRTFMYHGAEHRTINCFESGKEMTVKNVQSCSTKHNRCGTTFLFFVMVISIFVFAIANWLFALWGIDSSVYGKLANTFIRFAIRIALLPLVAGLSYELLKFLALLPDNLFTNILRAPGLALQRLTTYPPTDDMAEVALKSFMAVYNLDNDITKDTIDFFQFEVRDVKEIIAKALKDTNADSSESDWILCDVLDEKRSALNDDTRLNYLQYKRVKEILTRRKDNEPLYYILGYTEFYGEKIIVNKNALIPRMETELLCEKAIEVIGSSSMEVLDLCTGSGCISKVLSVKTLANITAVDISTKALSLAKLNLEGSSVNVVESDMFEALENKKFDLIVSNPPYIETETIKTLDIEVKNFEPMTALDGGDDGLNFYKIIAKNAPEFLSVGGKILLEIGFNQGKAVTELLSDSFENVKVFKDLDGNDRIVSAQIKTK